MRLFLGITSRSKHATIRFLTLTLSSRYLGVFMRMRVVGLCKGAGLLCMNTRRAAVSNINKRLAVVLTRRYCLPHILFTLMSKTLFKTDKYIVCCFKGWTLGSAIWMSTWKRPKLDRFWQVTVPLAYPTAHRHRSEAHSPYGGQVDKQKVGLVTGSVDSPICDLTALHKCPTVKRTHCIRKKRNRPIRIAGIGSWLPKFNHVLYRIRQFGPTECVLLIKTYK